ncbi:hypothetical protein ABFA07_003706 [Porites harrisoni]
MISPEDFYYKFMAKHKPIVIRKAASNWPASEVWTELYLMHAVSECTQLVSRLKDFPFGLKMHVMIKDFLWRSQQEDLMMFNPPSSQMLNDIIAPLCLRCHQFMNQMKVSYWLRQYQREDTTPLYFHSDEQMLTVLNGSVQVTLVSSLYSEKLPDDENQLFLISRSKEEIQSRLSSQGIPHFTVNLQKGDMLYIPQMWWQLLTLPSDPILFVQFLWPSKMQTSSVVQSSFKTRDNQLSSIQKAIKSLLRRYEERFLGTNVPSLFCSHQDMRMSDFTFETGKMSDEEYQFFHNGPDFTETEPCNFDELNKQSPCHFPTCYEDAESAECIRYILDYCNQWEDRGCVIELPQLLNKVDEHRMEEITTMKSPYQ